MSCTHTHTHMHTHTHTHAHTGMAATFCKQVGAKQLILTHFSQRYKTSETVLQPGEEGIEKLVSEAEEVLSDSGVTVHAAEDLKVFVIPSKK